MLVYTHKYTHTHTHTHIYIYIYPAKTSGSVKFGGTRKIVLCSQEIGNGCLIFWEDTRTDRSGASSLLSVEEQQPISSEILMVINISL